MDKREMAYFWHTCGTDPIASQGGVQPNRVKYRAYFLHLLPKLGSTFSIYCVDNIMLHLGSVLGKSTAFVLVL